MKKIFISIAFFVLSFSSVTAIAQDAADNTLLFKVLQSYYHVKDALVAGNALKASESATSFIKNLNGISLQLISEGNVNSLLKDAGSIADAKSLDKQRATFANFSSNMTGVAKALKLSEQAVYIQYCPMKKAYWLSSEQAIKNPYYGSSMLTCGNVTETIN